MKTKKIHTHLDKQSKKKEDAEIIANAPQKINRTWLFVIAVISFVLTYGAVMAVNNGFKIAFLKTFKPFNLFQKKGIELEKEFLSDKGDIYIDPLAVKVMLDEDKRDWLLVDYRSHSEYEGSHIKGAINIPLYKDYTKALETQYNHGEWLGQFNKAMKGKKMAILYGYWEDSAMGKKLAQYLLKKGARFRMMSVGFTDFKNNFNRWLPGGEMNNLNIGIYIEGRFIDPGELQMIPPPLPLGK